MKSLLLLSASKLAGWAFLMYGAQEIKAFLGDKKKILFIPYAEADHDDYFRLVRIPFGTLGYEIESIHTSGNPKKAIESSDVIFVGGGNTYRLLKKLQDEDLLNPIRNNVEGGLSYIGSGAGAVITSPTIQTTNDMPIVVPQTHESLAILPVHLNVHFPGKELSIGTYETREERLVEFVEENDAPVLGLREGAMLVVEDKIGKMLGKNGARFFRNGERPREIAPDETLNMTF